MRVRRKTGKEEIGKRSEQVAFSLFPLSPLPALTPKDFGGRSPPYESAKRSSSTSMRLANACHALFARHRRLKWLAIKCRATRSSLQKARRQKVGPKNRVFFEKMGVRRERRFSIFKKPRKTPLCILWRNSPLFKKRRENDTFRDVADEARSPKRKKLERPKRGFQLNVGTRVEVHFKRRGIGL
jgi:hypothetical protein